MPELNPPESQLGFSSPALGPWFESDFLLAAPESNLSVRIPAPFVWLPPASGLLSLLVNNEQQPSFLAGLKQPDGSPAFSTGSVIALFRLLPEVEARLDALLSGFIPSVDGALVAAGVQRRARIRHLAIEIVDAAAQGLDPEIWDVDPPAELHSADLGERAAHLGLELAAGVLRNTDRPMRDLMRPGRFTVNGSSATQVMLRVGGLVGDAFLWAFDERGLCVDPGAVADWWATLAVEQFENQFLWAPGLDPAERRTVEGQPARTVHLVNPHEGRVQELEGAVTATNLQGAGSLRRHEPLTATARLSIASPEPNQPRRLALLPNGRYTVSTDLWPVGVTFRARDFVRVALVDLDRHLVGPPAAPDAIEVRARVRPVVRPDAGNVLRDSVDSAAAALVETLDGAGERHFAASVLSRDFGAFPVAVPPAAAQFPERLDDPVVTALVGGGGAEGDTIAEQRVLVDITVDAELAGAWVRAWPQGFDDEEARHVRLNGGGAPVRADGAATVVLTLPSGALSSLAPMGIDVLVSTGLGSRLYPDLRFQRPTPVGGAAIPIDAATGPFTVCETGQVATSVAELANPGRIPPGAVVVARGAVPALVDPASLGVEHLTGDAVLSRLTQGLSVALTEPAFRRSPRGTPVESLSTLGADVDEVPRNGLDAIVAAGAPLPGQERLDVAAARLSGQDARATLASSPALARFHEQLPHQSGHPGVPATDEVHGTGAVLTGPAALPVIEFLRDRTARATLPDLFNAARNLLPNLPQPPGAVRWTALLRTVSPGVEGEPGLGVAAQASGFPFGESLDDILSFLASFLGGLPQGISGAIPEAQAVARALDRRIFGAARGFADALRSVRHALSRAEHFVYIETPAADILEIGGEDQAVWSALLERMQVRRGLAVLVCHPVHLMPGAPLRLEHVRNALITELPLAGGRIELFSVNAGPNRSLRQASTTVIVDDAYVMTGTTHLWRRGMTFDSSVAIAAFDEQLDRGRPAEIRAFRRNLIAGRLGITPSQLPEDPQELLLAIRQLRKRGGGHRLATELKEAPELAPTPVDVAVWNRDGLGAEQLEEWLAELFALVQSGPLQDAFGDEVSTPQG